MTELVAVLATWAMVALSFYLVLGWETRQKMSRKFRAVLGFAHGAIAAIVAVAASPLAQNASLTEICIWIMLALLIVTVCFGIKARITQGHTNEASVISTILIFILSLTAAVFIAVGDFSSMPVYTIF